MAKSRYECGCGKKPFDTPELRAQHEQSKAHLEWLAVQDAGAPTQAVDPTPVVPGPTAEEYAAMQARLAELEAQIGEPSGPVQFDWDEYVTVFPGVKDSVNLMNDRSIPPDDRHKVVAKTLRQYFSSNYLPNSEFPPTVLDVCKHFGVPVEHPSRYYPDNVVLEGATVLNAPPARVEQE